MPVLNGFGNLTQSGSGSIPAEDERLYFAFASPCFVLPHPG